MKATILFVDDDDDFLENLQGAFDDFAQAGRYRLLTAHSVTQAIDTLANAHIDLLVTDIHMPVADGFELIAHASRNHPGLPILALTGSAEAWIADAAQRSGALVVLQKPIGIDALHARMIAALEARVEGRISGVTVSSFMQLIELGGKSCLLAITSREREGELVIAAGTVVEARTGALRGREAALEIARWDPASISITSRHAPKIATGIPIRELLAEAGRGRGDG